MHRFLLGPGETLSPGPLRVEGDQAHHAVRVKRLRADEPCEVLDGVGSIAPARVASMDPRGRWIELDLDPPRRTPPLIPNLEVCCPPPKGDRLAQLIDTLSQAGAAVWRPLRCARAAEPPPPNKVTRLERIAGEAAKQCGRAWVMRLEPPIDFDEALSPQPGVSVILSDISGEPAGAPGHEPLRLLVGPEGGWTDQELERARAGGARITRFGAHTMRIETAALAASAVLLAGATRDA